MKLSSVCFQLLLLLYGFVQCCQCQTEVHNLFLNFIKRFGRKYTYGSDEYTRRYGFYKENLKWNRELNEPYFKLGARYGETKFSDLSHEEFKELYLNDLTHQPYLKSWNQSAITPSHKLKQLNIPDKLDWRKNLNYSVVSPIKNQKKCGGCWAFSTVETVESVYSIKTGRLPPLLSVQEVIDCSSNNNGCDGGDTCRALYWMVHTPKALVSESIYPLTDESNICKIVKNDTKGLHVYTKDYDCSSRVGQEDEVLNLLQKGPVVAAVDATTWSNYQGGIIQYHCEGFNNHAIQIVGYDKSGEVPYYIVRNSWGTDFGDNGYIYIRIGENVCGSHMSDGKNRTSVAHACRKKRQFE